MSGIGRNELRARHTHAHTERETGIMAGIAPRKGLVTACRPNE